MCTGVRYWIKTLCFKTQQQWFQNCKKKREKEAALILFTMSNRNGEKKYHYKVKPFPCLKTCTQSSDCEDSIHTNNKKPL